LIIAAGPDGLFFDEGDARILPEFPRIGQWMPIVAETNAFSNRGNSPAKSRARIYDGSQGRFFVTGWKNLCHYINESPCVRTIEWE
jgi:hypothetical protein